MKNTLNLFSLALIGCSANLSAATLATAPFVLSGGHFDAPAFGYDTADGFEPHIHNEGGASEGAIVNGVRETNDTEYEPSDVVVSLLSSSVTSIGAQDYFWLPSSETQAAANNVPYLGIGTEELELGDWAGDTVTITITSVTQLGGGTGDLRIWSVDGVGTIVDRYNSSTGTTSFDVPVASDNHFNWGFTEEGEYDVAFQVSGTHLVDGAQVGSDTFSFAVVPEPSTALLTALGGLLLARRRRS